jgi:hypothetical protein
MTDTHRIISTKARAKRKAKNYLKLYEAPYLWSAGFGCFLKNIGHFFYCFKLGWQRARKGYNDYDVWDTGDTIIKYMINILNEFRNRTYSYPDRDFDTFDDYIEYIDGIITLLEYSLEDRDKHNPYTDAFDKVLTIPPIERTEEESEICHKYWEMDTRIYEQQCAAKAEALARFNKYVNDFWL